MVGHGVKTQHWGPGGGQVFSLLECWILPASSVAPHVSWSGIIFMLSCSHLSCSHALWLALALI